MDLHTEYDNITERLDELDDEEYQIRTEIVQLLIRRQEIEKELGWDKQENE